MMKKTELFTINGKPLPAPDAGVEFSYEDLDASDSGRTEDGVMHRSVIRYKVGAWSFAYSCLTEEERRYMESLFPDEPDFRFGHPDRRDASRQAETRAYRSKCGISWYDARRGLWRNYKFNIIEC